jgi:hypothetical protein
LRWRSANPNADSYTYANTYANSDTNSDTNSDANPDANPDSDTNTGSAAERSEQSDSDSKQCDYGDSVVV